MEHFIGNKFEKNHAKFSLEEVYEYQIQILLFAASWSPPCVNLIEHLISLYEDLNNSDKTLEIVFVSCDFTTAEFEEFIKKMPWCYIPFSEVALRQIVTRHYEVLGIPSMLLIDNLGACISNTVLSDISSLESDQCKDLWLKKVNESARSL